MNASSETLSRAREHWLADDHETALGLFRQAMGSDPSDLRLAVEVASYLGLRFEIDEAVAILKRCEARLEGNVGALYQIALAYERAYRPDEALRCAQEAVRTDPNHFPSWLQIASWYDRRGRLEEARNAVAQCSETQPEVLFALANLQVRQGAEREAEANLQELTSAPHTPSDIHIQAWYRLAQLHHQQGRADDAVRAAESAKQIQCPMAAPQLKHAQQLAKLEASFVTTVHRDHYQRWAADSDHRGVALLTGSPRSGTTLMARILGNHASILLADEINAYATYAHKELLAGKQGRSAGEVLDAITAERLDACRSRYLRWMFAAIAANDDGRLLLDKNPSTTFLIPAFRRLFPKATMVIAIRDPRDVVISCFLQYFPLNPVSAMFNRLELTVMRCRAEIEAWLRLRDELTPPWCEVYYEKLAHGDHEDLRTALTAMGVVAEKELVNFQASLAASPARSPTYAQLFEPINTRSVGRWQAYEKHLQPYLKQLEPACQALGYA